MTYKSAMFGPQFANITLQHLFKDHICIQLCYNHFWSWWFIFSKMTLTQFRRFFLPKKTWPSTHEKILDFSQKWRSQTFPKFDFLDFCWIFSKNDASSVPSFWIFFQDSRIGVKMRHSVTSSCREQYCHHALLVIMCCTSICAKQDQVLLSYVIPIHFNSGNGLLLLVQSSLITI